MSLSQYQYDEYHVNPKAFLCMHACWIIQNNFLHILFFVLFVTFVCILCWCWWQYLTHSLIYRNDGTIHITRERPTLRLESRAVCEQINKQTANETIMVVEQTTGWYVEDEDLIICIWTWCVYTSEIGWMNWFFWYLSDECDYCERVWWRWQVIEKE